MYAYSRSTRRLNTIAVRFEREVSDYTGVVDMDRSKTNGRGIDQLVVLCLPKEAFRHLVELLVSAPINLNADSDSEMALYEVVGTARMKYGV
jgi:hypothetical protein